MPLRPLRPTSPSTERDARRSPVWRAAVPVMFLVAGGLFVTSATSADGIDLRSGRYSDLDELVSRQSEEVEELRAEQAALTEQIERLSEAESTGLVEDAQERADELRRPAGLVPVEGPGITVTLTDAPESVIESLEGTDTNLNDLVVHQQDIQAVANAMWAGGAEAMSIQGQRVVSTTGIKCVGNTVILHGVPYAPPYVLSAVGNPESMLTSINTNDYLGIYRDYAQDTGLGYDLDVESELALPGYEGPLDMEYARVAGGEDSPRDSDI